jgi:hypothetical protein
MIRKLTTAIITTAMLGGLATAASASTAQAAACTSSTAHSHSVTSRGTVSDRWTTKVSCGTGTYDEWEHGWTHSYTGASSTFHSYKDDDAGCWNEVKVTHSVSARGTVSNRTTYTSGGTC